MATDSCGALIRARLSESFGKRPNLRQFYCVASRDCDRYRRYAAPRCSVAAYLLVSGSRPLPLLSLLCPSTALLSLFRCRPEFPRMLRWLLRESFQATNQGFVPQDTREARAVDHGPHVRACCHQCTEVSKSRHRSEQVSLPIPDCVALKLACSFPSRVRLEKKKTLHCGKPASVEGALCTAILHQFVAMNSKDVIGPANIHAGESLQSLSAGAHAAQPPVRASPLPRLLWPAVARRCTRTFSVIPSVVVPSPARLTAARVRTSLIRQPGSTLSLRRGVVDDVLFQATPL